MKQGMLIFIMLIACHALAAMPGYLLLIGGGTEQDTPNSWNAQAYQWAVDHAENKRVAIVHYESGSSWLEDYLVNVCGAEEASSHVISSRSQADLQETYDKLAAYDMLFFRGGDQQEYYETYKGTKTQEAIEHVFNNGGVLAGTSAGMAMLSGVMFTAANGTVYPEECMNDPQNNYVTLADDFLQLFPGWVFDTHVAERGRLPRSLAFMANWYITRAERINAVALDDMTALAIDSSMQATVYGTGAARILTQNQSTTFSAQNGPLSGKEIQNHQLLQGWQYHFKTGEVTATGANTTTPGDTKEQGNFTLLLSGSNERVYNDGMLDYFINRLGDEDEQVLLIKGYNAPQAANYEAKLNSMGVNYTTLTASIGNMGAEGNAEKVRNAEKYLFVNNTPGALLNFVKNSDAGQLLKKRLRNKGRISAFVGDDSRLAGHTVVENYKTEDASYYHDLQFAEGLKLLSKTALMPHTFYKDTVTLYENTQTALPYAMARDTLVNGIWLNKENFAVYYTREDTSYLKSYGKWPALLMRNKGGAYGFSEQTSYGYASDEPRMVAGLEHSSMYILKETDSLKMGSNLTSTGMDYRGSLQKPAIRIYPVPANSALHMEWQGRRFSACVYNLSGKIMMRAENVYHNLRLDTSDMENGLYFVDFTSDAVRQSFTRRFLVAD